MLKYFIVAFALSLAACAPKAPNAGAQVVERCWNSERSHAAAVDCEDEMRKGLRTKMESVYESAKKEDRELEQEFRAMHSVQYNDLEAQLVSSQKAFLEYMDKECTYTVAGYGAGTAGADGREACEIRLMTQRIKELGGKIND